MNSVVIINLLAITLVTSLPTNSTNHKTNIFQEFKNYSVTKCPELDKSLLSDPNSKYFEECTAFPTETNLTGFNTEKFFCAGVLDAEYKLCNVLGRRKIDLPKDFDSLNKKILKISQTDKFEVCKSLQKINETAETITKPYLVQLNDFLKNEDFCSKICQSVITKTNKFCSLISYIYDLIDKVKALDLAEKSKSSSVLTELKNNTPTIDNKQSTPTSNIKVAKLEEQPNLTNIQVKKTDLSPKTISLQVQTNPQNYPVENAQIQNKKIDSKSLSQNYEQVSSTSVKSTTKAQTVSQSNFEQGVNQIDKNQLKTDLKPQENGLGTGIMEEQKFNKDDPLTNLDEIKEDGPQQNEDVAYDMPEDDFDVRNDPSLKAHPTVTARKEFIEKDIPEKLLIPEKQYPTQYEDPEDSNFFTYFMFISVLFIGVYIAYHNKQKILALVLEGRRDRNSRRRPNTASYRKLNSNLEEAVTSKSGGSASNIIY